MIEHYPHTCIYQEQGTPDVWDEVNGGYVPGNPGAERRVPCRVSASGGKTVRTRDGSETVYSYDISFPVEAGSIERGEEVTLLGLSGEVLTKGRLIDFMEGQLHGRAWI